MQTLDTSRFQVSRLIPTTGIKGALDQERRASSALLAVFRIVPGIGDKPRAAPIIPRRASTIF